MSLWGDPGPVPIWGYHAGVEIGQSIDLVAEIRSVADDSVLVNLIPGHFQAKLIGSLQVPLTAVSVSVFDATLVQKEPMLGFLVDDPEDALFHDRSTRTSFSQIIELCSGLGIGSYGFREAGMTPVVGVDWSQPLVEAFKAMHPFVPCIHGDIASKQTLKQVYKVHPHPAVLMCGFSCQPFSTGGFMLGASDLRSNTLYSALRAGYMLRSVAIVLECVEGAASNSMVRLQLEEFRTQCGFHLSEVDLKLDEIWVSRRTRWWATLTAEFLGPVQLRASDPFA